MRQIACHIAEWNVQRSEWFFFFEKKEITFHSMNDEKSYSKFQQSQWLLPLFTFIQTLYAQTFKRLKFITETDGQARERRFG